MKVVVNRCYGGFSLSPKAIEYYLSLKELPCYFYVQTKYRHEGGKELFEKRTLNALDPYRVNFVFTTDLGETFSKWPKDLEEGGYFYDRDVKRNDPFLVKTIEDLGTEVSSGYCASLAIIEIPDDIEWFVDEYDGFESIHEQHRSW